MPGRPRRSCESCSAQKASPPRRSASKGAYTDIALPTINAPRSGVPPVVPVEPSLSCLHIPEKRYFGVPSALLPTLIDLYYTHLYNASLLVHRPSLASALESETIRIDVLLSICALASKFYTDSKGSAVLVDNHFGREWAEAAGRMVFREVENPCEDNVVAFLNLALFWYSNGWFQRSNMHSSCASNTAWSLGVPINEQGNEGPLESEMRRRRFWACYLLCSFQWDSLFPKIPTDTMLNMRLPCSEYGFVLENPEPGVSLKSTESTKSIFAELIRVIALWSSVVALIKQSESSLANRLVEIQILDGRIREAWSKLDVCLRLDCSNMASVPPDDLPKLLSLHIIYHQCFCSLHSSIVPLFSWSACEGVFSYAQQLSAQIAFEHANSVSDLLQTALNLDWDSRRMPSFIGYAAYCACAIQTPFLWCSHPDVKQRAVYSILANLKTLQILGTYWAFLKILGRFACGLYKVHASGPFPLTDEPKNMTPEALKGFKSANSRARLSILTHNEIIVSDQGSTAQAADDIGDLGLDDAESRGAASVEENIANFISQIPHEVRATSSQLPMTMDPFVLAENFNLYEPDGSFIWTREPGMDQFGHIENWISELLQEGA
ncbi:uncharacterized protein TRUGW13939_08309 [Talaromyces rugulosus]|uniref:Transcription factor domain-containing protein n=1 Tax=Talaromyces rugulosus TaxID=121627 RepID=A0A7H8R497_TALRU|nr:uncharacterized protein TRUGW13939_08309 [Talaromyces rugulosus]QKX61162.1 hypothetical protein TRUGW13939_08309 [Talaromyces rugulosus]